MFNFLNVDRRLLTLLMIALVIFFTTVAIPADEIGLSGQHPSVDLTGQAFDDPDEEEPDPDPRSSQKPKSGGPHSDPFDDPDEEEPDPDPFDDPDEEEPDPDPFDDPDEEEPDPDPATAEVYPLAFTESTTMLFRMEGAALMELYNSAGQRLFAVGDGVQVVKTLTAGRYQLRVEEWKDARGAVRLHIEQVSSP